MIGNAPQVQQSVNEDVPAGGTGAAFPERPQQPEKSFGDYAKGIGEAALTLGTGATGGTLGFLAGSVEGAARELVGNIEQGEGLKLAEERAAGLTYAPRGEVGQDITKAIGEGLGALPPVLVAGAPSFSLGAKKLRAPKNIKEAIKTKEFIVNEIKQGNINAGNIAKTLDVDGKLITNKNTKKAIELLGKGDEAYSAAINFEKMNNETRIQVNKMLDDIQANKNSGDPLDIMENRPVNRIGESLAVRLNKLDTVKKGASKRIGQLMNGKAGNKVVDVSQARDRFIRSLNKSDIDVGVNDDGKLIANTDRTLTNIEEVIKTDKLNNILNRIESGNMTAKEAHRIKRNLAEMVSFDPAKPGAVKVSAEIEKAVKSLSSELSNSISKVDSRYKRANKAFSESIDTLKKADKMLGNQLMIGDELASSKLGSLSKRIGGNLANRESTLSLIKDIDDSLAKRDVFFKDDIKRQVATLIDLEKIFKIETAQAPVGFQSRVAQGAAEAALTGNGPVTQLSNLALDKFRDMSKLDFDQKMKALRAMSKVKEQGN
jgi:hypothetical protein